MRNWAERVEKLMPVKGVKLMTVATIVAETQSFEHFKKPKQVINHAGYDVLQRKSETFL